MKSALFCSSVLKHKKFQDRYDALIQSGYEVTVLGLQWDYGSGDAEARPIASIVIPRGRRLTVLGRVVVWARLMLAICFLLPKKQFELVVANTLEMAVFAELVAPRGARKLFDLADVHPHQYTTTLIGRLARTLERSLCLKGWSYVVTSPWFYWDYVVPRVSSSVKAYLVENKVRPQVSKAGCSSNLEGREASLLILWNGVLRCNTSGEILWGLLSAHPTSLRLRLAGDHARLDQDLVRRLLGLPNVESWGRYRDEDLAPIFSGVDLVWISDFDDGDNSRMLLPNRLYQACHFHVATLSVGENAGSKYVSTLGLGVVVKSLEAEVIMRAIQAWARDGRVVRSYKPSPQCWKTVLRQEATPVPTQESLTWLSAFAQADTKSN